MPLTDDYSLGQRPDALIPEFYGSHLIEQLSLCRTQISEELLLKFRRLILQAAELDELLVRHGLLSNAFFQKTVTSVLTPKSPPVLFSLRRSFVNSG